MLNAYKKLRLFRQTKGPDVLGKAFNGGLAVCGSVGGTAGIAASVGDYKTQSRNENGFFKMHSAPVTIAKYTGTLAMLGGMGMLGLSAATLYPELALAAVIGMGAKNIKDQNTEKNTLALRR